MPVLLVSTATDYIGTAKIPAALANAGFEVALLTPHGTLAAKSRHVARCVEFGERATPQEWLAAFGRMVEETRPRLALPCDDNAFRLLRSLVNRPPDALPPAERQRLATLARESLGDPAHYETSINKVLLIPAAEALGVRVPPYAIVSTASEAEAFAARQGFPVVLKLGYGVAGEWVRIVHDRSALSAALDELLAAPVGHFGESGTRSFLIQAFVDGNSVLQSIAAWHGTILAGYAREKLVADPAPKGPSTVSRTFHAPEARAFAERLTAAFGMHAFFGVEFIQDRHSGRLFLLEINRRITPGTPVGGHVGVDLCVALHAALEGRRANTRTDLDPGEEHVIAHFPQEFLRDPESRYLAEHRSDCPWDDPGLMEAMLALRHDR